MQKYCSGTLNNYTIISQQLSLKTIVKISCFKYSFIQKATKNLDLTDAK